MAKHLKCSLGFATACLLAVLVTLAGKAASAADAPVSFAGTWNTLSGPGNTPFTVTMAQVGSKVTGTYKPGNGKIFNGVVVGRKVTFQWTQDGGWEGTGEFTMDEDGKGFIGSSTALKPKQFTNQWGTPHKPPSSFAGVWDTVSGGTNNYVVTLQQTGNKVTGTYTPGDGKLEGTVSGKIFRFKWSEGGRTGSGRFVMSEGNRSFAGGSNAGENPDDVDATWDGKVYVPASFAGAWDTDSGGDYKYGVQLQQTGDKVTGFYAPGNGRILDGVVDHNFLRFKWTQDGGLSGAGRFELSADGKAFKGYSNNGTNPDDIGNTWKGTRTANTFAGSWELTLNSGVVAMNLVRESNGKFTGSFKPGNGKISNGTVTDKTLTFDWTQDGGQGTGRLEISDDGLTVKGSMNGQTGVLAGETAASGARRAPSFDGMWNMLSAGAYKYGVTFKQTGDKLTGTFTPGNGRIDEGQIIGSTVYFRWTQDGGHAGTGHLTIGARGRTFAGGFRDGGNAEILCTGTRDHD